MGLTPVVKVEEARRLDALHLLSLHREVLEEGRWFITRPDEFAMTLQDREREIAGLRSSSNSVFLVARLPGRRVAGFLTLYGGILRRMRATAKLEIMVHREVRGRGVGEALLRAGIAWATACPELHKVGLAVFADNTRAIQLYLRHGFVEEGRRVNEYVMEDGEGRDDLLLSRAV